ncbi:MAG TPA: hypothetical protein VHU19_06930 [Pyrinomonadaceae bacterium]|jgi:hypothetical protein|nr:hypothetical protein [Pyrinomonadaceae bacterium]
MRKAFFSAAPIALLLFPLLARTSLWFPSASRAGNAGGVARALARPSEPESVSRVRTRISEAKRLLASDPAPVAGSVRLAVGDESGQIQLLTLPKETFLSKGAEAQVATSQGSTARLRVERANGVNTAVSVTGADGRPLQPLAVEYPIERNGEVTETAFYTAAHPALESTEMADEGRQYVRRTLDEAAAQLEAKGLSVSPDIVNVAERLCLVEHADHKRFLSEDRGALLDEIETLYELNAGDTFRYSISTAGAGGMVQMIPKTYQAIREHHPQAQLNSDFVEGMRDHDNAAEAMLLYMQDTWDGLSKEDEVAGALKSGVATQAELLAAGYNSNPMRLAKYLARGGTGWRTLVPRETQMYLQIYAAFDGLGGRDGDSPAQQQS